MVSILPGSPTRPATLNVSSTLLMVNILNFFAARNGLGPPGQMKPVCPKAHAPRGGVIQPDLLAHAVADRQDEITRGPECWRIRTHADVVGPRLVPGKQRAGKLALASRPVVPGRVSNLNTRSRSLTSPQPWRHPSKRFLPRSEIGYPNYEKCVLR
jgi:hypothetical protein